MHTFDRETKQLLNAARTLGNKGISVYLEDAELLRLCAVVANDLGKGNLVSSVASPAELAQGYYGTPIDWFVKTTEGGIDFPTAFLLLREQIEDFATYFALGFPNDLFYRMKPLEQRLAVYLAKKFTSQKIHRRYLDDLAAALPVEATRPRDAKAIIKAAADGLLGHRLPILVGFGFEAATGRTVITFERKVRPAGDARVKHFRPAPLTEAEAAAVARNPEGLRAREGQERFPVWAEIDAGGCEAALPRGNGRTAESTYRAA